MAGIGLALHAVLTMSGVGWSIWHHTVNVDYNNAYQMGKAVGLDLLLSFGISTATVVTIAEVNDTIMVIAHFVGQQMKKEGLAQGRAEGRAEVEAQVEEWFKRLLDAHPELKDTIEPLPIRKEKPSAD